MTTKARGKASRRTLRGWMTLTDLLAAACATWAAIGGWQTHSFGETVLRFALVYGGVHLLTPLVRSNGGHR